MGRFIIISHLPQRPVVVKAYSSIASGWRACKASNQKRAHMHGKYNTSDRIYYYKIYPQASHDQALNFENIVNDRMILE